MGIAELGSFMAAAGMAAGGRTVIASTYGVFASMRALEAVRTFICYPNLNVKFLASHGGLTAAIDGVTHQATEDIGILSTLPNMKIIVPADPVSASASFDLALETPGPVYTRLMRDPLFNLYEDNEVFEIGKSKIVTEGSDITILTYGDLVFESIKAADKLKGKGIHAEIIDAFSIKPFDYKKLYSSIKKTGKLLVVENHQKRNGLGYDVAASILTEGINISFSQLGLNDTFAESGNYYKIIDKYGLSADRIYSETKNLLNK